MDSPPLIPVEPNRPPTPAPLPSRRSAQVALASALLLLVGLLVFRGYGNRVGARPTDGAADVPAHRVDLNGSDPAELEQVPGIGPKLARAIDDHRRTRGPFRSVDELRGVQGFGPATVDKVRPFVRVDEGPPEPLVLARKPAAPPPAAWGRGVKKLAAGDPPINVNAASVDDLQRLPMVGPTLAQRIVDRRATAPFAAVDDLRKVKGVGAKTLDALRPFAVVK